ncbi:MAG: hypothetical protein ACYDC1_00080 [Limisphaerales bacterium]
MKRLALIGIVGFLVLVAAVTAVFLPVNSSPRHLTETPPQKVKLQAGTNALSFPVVRGRYLLRVGREDLEPTSFTFSVRGFMETPTGRISLDEDYVPREEVLAKRVSGGCVSRAMDISASRGQVAVKRIARFPEQEGLTGAFPGIQ